MSEDDTAPAGASPKRRWLALQPMVPEYDDPEFHAARRAWLAWYQFGKAAGWEGRSAYTAEVAAP